MVLIGVVVLGMIIVNLVVFSTPTNTRIPSIEASMTNRTSLITIVHQGGDSIPFGEFKILVDGVDRTGDFANSGTYPWSVGETLSYNGTELPRSAIMIYNGTGGDGVIILQTRFPWGVYVGGPQWGSGGVGTLPPTMSGSSYPWYDCSWGYRKNITIDHTKVSGTQTNFPVLISLSSDADLSARAQGDGDDILFTTDDGTTKLSHEIESYSSGTLVAWVKVPSINPATDTTIMMYYGNSGASSQQDATNVWDSSYKAVWHLEEAVTDESTAGTHYDSTSNGNNGAQTNNGPVAGKISGAQTFDGSDWIQGPNSASLDMSSQVTVEAWVYLANSNNNQKIVGKTSHPPTGGYLLGVQSGGLYPECWDTSGTDYTFTSGSISPSSWTHLALTWTTGGSMVGYVNGAQVNSIAASASNLNSTASSGWMRAGATPWGNPPVQFFVNGRIDEVRISSSARSAQWIATEYANQNSPSTFSSVGSQLGAPSSCGGTTPTPTPTPIEGLPWYDCDWGYRKNITVDHTKVSGTQAGFPVLVSLAADAGLSAHAQGDGDDILFTDVTGAKLPHEIESYSAGTLVAWVRAPSVSSAADSTIVMYYGNSGASSQQNPTSVWDNSYKAVWHLGEAVTDNAVTAGVHKDSTENDADGTQNNNNDVAGKIGLGQDFEGDARDEYVEIPNSGTMENLQEGDYTVEAWFYSDTTPPGTDPAWNSYYDVVSKEGYNIGLEMNYARQISMNHWLTTGNKNALGVAKNNLQWYHVVGVVSKTSGSTKIYVDGVNEATNSWAAGSAAREYGTLPWRIGIASTGRVDYAAPVNGKIDEVRLSSTARSAQWIATEYANQNSPSTFSSVGSEESSTCGGLSVFNTCTWPLRKKITIDKTKVAGSQTNFPVLVSLASDSDLAADAQDDGDDLVFTASDGTTQLSHEIESFDGNTGALTAWVKVPSISSAANTDIYLYYGNPSSTNQQDPPGVWDSDYVGVWHLKESGTGAQGEFRDSTSSANHGQGGDGNSLYVPAQVAGKVGYAQNFSAVNGKFDFIDMGQNSVLDISGNAITLEAWVQHEVTSNPPMYHGSQNYYGILNHKGWNNGYRVGMDGEQWNCPTNNPFCVNFQLPGASYQTDSNTVLAADTWYHVAATYNGSYMALFLNGQVDGSMTAKSDAVTPSSAGEKDVWIGQGDMPTDVAWSCEWVGKLDEVRISKVGRSDSWVRTEYNNMNSPSTFSSIGSEEASPCSTPTPTPTPPSNWYDCSWGYRKTITIDHTKVSGTQTNFPVLVNLSSDSDLAARTQADGDDILFTSADGTTKIPHEIEYYHSGYGGLVTWVKVPSISSTTDTTIMMYYGNSGASSQQDKTNVWDSNYKGVWHLADTSGTTQDSTSYGTGGTVVTGITRGVTGRIGKAFDSSPTGDVSWGDPADGHLDFGTGNMTMDLWVNVDASMGAGAWPQVLQKGNDANAHAYWLEYDDDNNLFYFGINDASTQYGTGQSTSFSEDTWYHIVGVVDRANSQIRLYKNGAQQGSSVSISGYGSTSNSEPLTVSADGTWGWMDGNIDEIRLSDSARSATWIATEYANENSPSTFISVGSQTASGCSAPPAFDPCTWSGRKKITISHAKVSGTQTNFPVLVNISSDSDLAADAQDDGDDMVFTDSDGSTQLPHEIESFDGNTGALTAWVKVPSINSATDTDIYLYYGNAGTTSQQNPTGVWSNGYTAVYHLGSDLLDSTSDNYDGINFGTSATTGKIASGRSFTAPNSVNITGLMGQPSTITLSGWANLVTKDNGGGEVISLGDHAGIRVDQWGNGPEGYYYNGTLWPGVISSTQLTGTGWHYYTYVANPSGSSEILYIDGAANVSASAATAISYSGQGINTFIGTHGNGGTDYDFTGTIDEVHVASTTRSAQWIATEYANQYSPSTFITVGAEDTGTCIPPTPTPVPTPSPTPAYSWYNCNWGYRKNITIDHTKVSGTQTNFPVLVNLSADSGLAAHAQSDGDDILFTSADSLTKIPHEIESYTGTTGALIAWVNVSSINAVTDTTIMMYYGNSGASSQQDPDHVWDSNFRAVWHHQNSVFLDSTVYNNDGTNSGTTNLANSKIAGGRSYDGASNYVNAGSGSNIDNIFNGTGSGGTFEAWIYPVSIGENKAGHIADKSSNNDAANGWYLGTNTSFRLRFSKGFSTRNGSWVSPVNSTPPNMWHHVVVTYDNSSTANDPIFYINGTSRTVTEIIAPTGTASVDAANNMGIGNYITGTDRSFFGYIDEIRMSKGQRSAGWILTGYNNQNSPSSFISVGSEKSSPCGLGPGPWYVQSAGSHYNGGNSGTVTLPNTTIAGRLLVVSVIFDSTTLNVASVSDSVNGAVYNLALSPTTVASGWKMYTYYVNNSAAGGPVTATVTLSGSTSSILDIFLTEYGGIALVLPLDQTSAGTGTGTSMNSGSQTTTTASELIYGFGADDWDCHGTAPYVDRETTDAMCVMDRNVTATGSYSVAATQSQSGNWGLQMVTFKGA